MISFHCPNCFEIVKAPDRAAGRMGRCPKCRNKVRIPEQGTVENAENFAATFDTLEDATIDPIEDSPPAANDQLPPPVSGPLAARNPMTLRGRRQSPIDAFIAFRSMITIQVVRVAWMLGTAFITLGAFVYFVSRVSQANEVVDYLLSFLAFFAILSVGNILWRMVCEVQILFFRMHESLEEVLNEMRRR